MIHNNNKKQEFTSSFLFATCYNRVKFFPFFRRRETDTPLGSLCQADGVLASQSHLFFVSSLSVHLGIRLLDFLPCLSFSFSLSLVRFSDEPVAKNVLMFTLLLTFSLTLWMATPIPRLAFRGSTSLPYK